MIMGEIKTGQCHALFALAREFDARMLMTGEIIFGIITYFRQLMNEDEILESECSSDTMYAH